MTSTTSASEPSAAPGKPVSLPPTIQEVRSDETEPREFVLAPATTTSLVPAPVPASVPTASGTFNPPPAPLPASAATPPVVTQGDVLLIPRWVYVPYSPHTPNGPTKMPANIAGSQQNGPHLQAGDRGMTALSPMGAAPAPQANANQAMLLEQCLQQMKMMNQRMNELEAKSATKPVAPVAATGFLPPPSPPAFLPPASAPAAMLPLPPPLTAPTIPPAK